MTATFRRLSALAGLVFVVGFGEGQVTSNEPARTAAQQEIAKYLAADQNANEVSGLILMLISGLVAFFAVGLWSLMTSASGKRDYAWPMTGLVGGIGMAVDLTFLGAAIAAEGWLGDKVASQPALAQALFVSEQMIAAAILPFLAIFFLGFGMSTLGSGALPRWSAWVAFAAAALSVALSLQVVFPGSSIVNAIGIVHAVFALGWIAIAGGWMILTPGHAVEASTQPA